MIFIINIDQIELIWYTPSAHRDVKNLALA